MTKNITRRDVLRATTVAGVGVAAASATSGPALASSSRDHERARGGHGGLTIDKEFFGTMPDGRAVHRYTFSNARDVTVQMLTYGATIQTLSTPDRRGDVANVALGLKTLEEYRTISPYFGSTIGRYANRIANGTFTLDGKTYHIPTNDGDNTLHGGPEGFDTKVWDADEVVERDRVGVRFH